MPNLPAPGNELTSIPLSEKIVYLIRICAAVLPQMAGAYIIVRDNPLATQVAIDVLGITSREFSGIAAIGLFALARSVENVPEQLISFIAKTPIELPHLNPEMAVVTGLTLIGFGFYRLARETQLIIRHLSAKHDEKLLK